MLSAGRFPLTSVYSELEIALREFPEAAVLMLTPAGGRFSAARQCLEGGHPLLTEKPMSLDPEQARILAETARRRQVPFAVNQNYRYSSFAPRCGDCWKKKRSARSPSWNARPIGY